MEDSLTIIQSVGFPIFCVIALGYACYKFASQIMKANELREDKYINMLTKYSEQMDKLEQANADFVTVVGKMRDDINGIKGVLENVKTDL